MAKSKNTAFNVDYSRTNLASKIKWTDSRNKIDECEPFIDFIRCDDGDEFRFLHSESGEIIEESLFMFEAIKDKRDGNYYLCYSADFVIPDYDSKTDFVTAMKKSKGLVEVVLGFKDPKGKVIENCYEEFDNRQAKMVKS
jgi:hypothetical protein